MVSDLNIKAPKLKCYVKPTATEPLPPTKYDSEHALFANTRCNHHLYLCLLHHAIHI